MRELALHILDLLQNAREAGARGVELTIEETSATDRLTITVRDDGRGMDAATLREVRDPFYTTRTSRHVGLGIPLAAAAAEQTGGEMHIESTPGRGTSIRLTFGLQHWDRAPLGDMPATLLAVLLGGQEPDITYRHTVDGRVFAFDSRDVRRELNEVPLHHPLVREWLAGFLQEGEADLCAG